MLFGYCNQSNGCKLEIHVSNAHLLHHGDRDSPFKKMPVHTYLAPKRRGVGNNLIALKYNVTKLLHVVLSPLELFLNNADVFSF